MDAGAYTVLEKERVPDRFALHYVRQTEWHVWHALWFWAMGLGSAVFVLRQLYDIGEAGTLGGMPLPDLLGVVLVALGGIVLILDLGRPGRFLNSLREPGRSWIARGVIADFTFLILGVLYLLPGALPGLPWNNAPFASASLISQIFIGLMILMAAVIMVYPGLVLSASALVPFWDSPLVPVLFIGLAFQSGFGLVTPLLLGAGNLTPAYASAMGTGLLAALLANLGLTAFYAYDRFQSPGASRLSVQQLVGGWPFWLTVLVGMALPAVLIALAKAGIWTTPGLWLAAVLAVLSSLGWRYVQLRAGFYRTPLDGIAGR